jgi:hypothetical protein
VQLGENALFKGFENARVAEKRSFLSEQGFEQRLKFEAGFADGTQQVGAAGETLARHVLAHTSGEEPLSRFVEPDARALLNQHADFTQFVFGQTHWPALA